MPTCPECGDAHLEQQSDDWTFVCGGGHRFKLAKIKSCAGCGRYVDLLPNGTCKECNAGLREVSRRHV